MKERVVGTPDLEKETTSHIEAMRLQVRTRCGRLARLMKAHSQDACFHPYAVALHFFAHNFVHIHATLMQEEGVKTTPAMAAGKASKPMTAERMLYLMDPANITID